MNLKTTNIEGNYHEKPHDRYWIVYYLLLMMGLVHIIPWHFFLTASEYWMYKFRNISTEGSASDSRTKLQVEFSPAVTGALQISNVSFYVLGLFFGHKFKLHSKLYTAVLIVLFLFILSTIFIFINTDQWQGLFFGITIAIVGLISAVNAVLGLIVMEMASFFPPMYLGAYITGVGVATVFTAVLEVIALAIGISTTVSALVYFWTATAFIALVGSALVLVVNRNAFYLYHLKHHKKAHVVHFMSVARGWYLLKKIWPCSGIHLFYVLSSSSVHTCITVLVVSEETYFVPVISFVLISFMDYMGRLTAVKVKLGLKPQYLVVLSAIRCVIFVPLIMLCNAQPRDHLPVLFPHDYQFILIAVFYGFTSGYFGALLHTLVPTLVPPEELKHSLQLNIVMAATLLGIFSFLPFVTVNVI